MSDLFAARSQMAISLGFHIMFAVVGIAMPVLMVIAEDRWIRARRRGQLPAGPPLGAGDGHPVRGGRGVGHRPLLRARDCSGRRSWPSPVPSSGCRSRSRASPSSWRPSSSASTCTDGTARAARALGGRDPGRAQRRALGRVRGDRQRLDEHADRLPHGRGPRGGRRSVGRHEEPGRAHRDPAHDARRLRLRRLRGGRHPRLRGCSASRTTSSTGARSGSRSGWRAWPRCCSRSAAT